MCPLARFTTLTRFTERITTPHTGSITVTFFTSAIEFPTICLYFSPKTPTFSISPFWVLISSSFQYRLFWSGLYSRTAFRETKQPCCTFSFRRLRFVLSSHSVSFFHISIFFAVHPLSSIHYSSFRISNSTIPCSRRTTPSRRCSSLSSSIEAVRPLSETLCSITATIRRPNTSPGSWYGRRVSCWIC